MTREAKTCLRAVAAVFCTLIFVLSASLAFAKWRLGLPVGAGEVCMLACAHVFWSVEIWLWAARARP